MCDLLLMVGNVASLVAMVRKGVGVVLVMGGVVIPRGYTIKTTKLVFLGGVDG